MKLHDTEVITINGEKKTLADYAGKTLLIVNTATGCGLTPQFEGLEALHQRFKDRGFAVLGFPSNDFAQESGSSAQIADLCFNTYGVKFPMFAKTSVRGEKANPFFAALAGAIAGVEGLGRVGFVGDVVVGHGPLGVRGGPFAIIDRMVLHERRWR